MATDEESRKTRDNVTSALINTTRSVASIAAEDLTFQRSLNPAIADVLATQQARLLQVSQSLINIATARTGVDAPVLDSAEAIENDWTAIVDVFDSLLEKADACLDEYTGIIKKSDSPAVAPSSPHEANEVSIYSRKSQNILKPQRLFQRPPDNKDETPFKPLLKTKPYAIQALEESLAPRISEDGTESYQHPYQVEIENYSYPSEMYSTAEPIPYLPFATTTATFVDTMDGVKDMLEELKGAKDIAIDLEHHDTYSYIGIVSLMQISTRGKDWIIDTLKPWREELHVLNEVFANPAILKVLHGSTSDIVWLQRDLGLYVVGLFDTFHASRVLQHPKKSLKALLERYVNFNAQKKYQMADWRTRPLPIPMFEYARSDTHFLLYIYDNLRNEINQLPAAVKPETHPLQDVLRSSKEESLQTYTRVVYDVEQGTGAGGWASSLRSTSSLLSDEQLAVYKAIHRWRDLQARKEDTNPVIVMGRDTMFNVARALPDNVHALLGSHQPFPTNLRPRASELLEMIKKAKDESKNTPNPQVPNGSTVPPHTLSKAAEPQLLMPELDDKNRHTADRTNGSTDGAPITYESKLWGNALKEDAVLTSITDPAKPNHRLLVPLPSPQGLLEETFMAIAAAGRKDTEDLTEPVKRSQTNGTRVQSQDEVFVAKDHGDPKKQKVNQLHNAVDKLLDNETNRIESSKNNTTNGLENSQHEIDEESRQQSRAKRKQKRRARKVENGETSTNSNTVSELNVPFDYASAPSMMRSGPSSEAVHNPKRPINPYVKSLDAPQGMRRLQREKPGKSFTFKD